MDTLPLPPRPNLDHYRKRAKDLVSAARSRDERAVRAWAADWLGALAKSLGVTLTPFVQNSFDRAVETIEARVRQKTSDVSGSHGEFALADAQFLIAQAHGFENWSLFADHIRRVPPERTPFEAAADAVVDGDLPALERLIGAHPELIRAHSERVHAATLLHYVAANGVEDFRQRTPPNAVMIARYLLEAGAEVDGLADTYGRDRYQTTMNLLVSSTHPAEAGVQGQLVETLIDFGAAVDGLDNDSSPLMTALFFGYDDAVEALARRGARVDNIVAAAARGRVDLVDHFLIDGVTLRPAVPLVAPSWMRLPRDPAAHIELAFAWACKFGRSDVAHLMLDRGVNPSAKDSYAMTALHWAAGNGLTGVVKRLLALGAPLEVENQWGGTVLNSTLHFALYQPVAGVDYAPIVQMLVEAGADVRVVDAFPTGHHSIDEALRVHPRSG
jgi:ankyrin repeat protein